MQENSNKFLQTKIEYIYIGTYNKMRCLKFGENTNEFEFKI